MQRVVITGATGSIGVALIEQLLEHDIQVVAVVRKDSMRKKNIPAHVNVKIVELNLDRIKELPEILKQYGIGTCDVFYHFGWDGTFGNSRNNVQGQLKNIRYTLDAAEVAAQIGCKKFIGAGSQAEYGRVDGIKLDALTESIMSFSSSFSSSLFPIKYRAFLPLPEITSTPSSFLNCLIYLSTLSSLQEYPSEAI